MQQRGLFITFEGPDGAGKTTQIEKFAAYLQKHKWQFLLTREPGGTRIGDHIRSLLLDPEHKEMANEAEVLLYAASRAQHVLEKIMPALEEGITVLCDRFVDASIAYQGYGLNMDVETIREINHFATGGLSPDRSYFIDISPEKAQERLIDRNEGGQLDRIEQKQADYHKRVREGFIQLSERERHRICLLDGHQDASAVFSLIQKDFESFCHERNEGGLRI